MPLTCNGKFVRKVSTECSNEPCTRKSLYSHAVHTECVYKDTNKVTRYTTAIHTRIQRNTLEYNDRSTDNPRHAKSQRCVSPDKQKHVHGLPGHGQFSARLLRRIHNVIDRLLLGRVHPRARPRAGDIRSPSPTWHGTVE